MRDWLQYAEHLPMERQGIAPFCVSYAVCNAYEIIKKSRGININLSDRYLAVISGTNTYGNTFPNVLTTFHTIGVVKEEHCPFPWIYRISYKLFWDRIFDLSKVDEEAPRYHIHNWGMLEANAESIETALNRSPILLTIDGYRRNSRHAVVGLNLKEFNLTVFDSVLLKFRTIDVETDKIYGWIYYITT